MWFAFPKGVSAASFQQQDFKPEVTDEKGRGYFRAPNHFAPVILGVPGFVQLEPPPSAGAPADLPAPDPLRDGALAQMGREIESLKRELASARADVVSGHAAFAAVTKERDLLRSRVLELQKQLEDAADDKDNELLPTAAPDPAATIAALRSAKK